MIHPSLPQTKTAEALGAWIKENNIEIHVKTDEHELSPEEIQDHEHKCTLATRAIGRLDEIVKRFKDVIKGGTQEIFKIEIPETKGMDVLKANQKFHSDVLEKGKIEIRTEFFAIPYPEKKMIIYVDQAGEEDAGLSRKMTTEEVKQYNTLFAQAREGSSDSLFNV